MSLTMGIVTQVTAAASTAPGLTMTQTAVMVLIMRVLV